MENDQISPTEPSSEALSRYQAVSHVLIRERNGDSRPDAMAAVAATEHLMADGRMRNVSLRTLYRWTAAFEAQGFKGLVPVQRSRTQDSVVLPVGLLDFFKSQKAADPRASTPELIRRAKEVGLVGPEQTTHRSTVWRSLKRMGVDTRRRKAPPNRDCRRFAYPHRMDMVLCDGKHFRAGPGRLRRVVLFFLDDATRLVLGAVVGTAESAQLFLRGLFESLRNHGRMSTLYVDNGSGFIANDAIEVLRKLGVLFVHGTAGYPEGRGKVERFNRTASDQALRFLDGNPAVDPDCSALELRLRHYLTERYNQTPHESLKGHTPWDRFHNDDQPLRFYESEEKLRQAFVLHQQRRVSNDNVVSLDGVSYEVPAGYAKNRVTLHCHMLDKTVAMLHLGRLMRLAPVDLAANAHDRRAKIAMDSEEPSQPLTQGSAQMAFERDHCPLVDAEGNFSCKEEKNE